MARKTSDEVLYPSHRRSLAISLGDPNGVGPEITLKALRYFSKKNPRLRFHVYGDWGPYISKTATGKLNNFSYFTSPSAPSGNHPGGFSSGWAIDAGISACLEGTCSALVTAPISKSNLNAGGFPFPGHTEFLQSRCGVSSVTMMLANQHLRVSLATVHIPLREVSTQLSSTKLGLAIDHTIDALRSRWGISMPKVAVCGLNPHAGDSGLLGDEEETWIRPYLTKRAIELKKQRRAELAGPFPADSLFARHFKAPRNQKWDAVIALYHDQGLIPVKLLDFGQTVNVTLNLPMIRTSVDHGTAFDIAGKNSADASSMIAAIEEALRILRRSRKGLKS